eukprot:jgi/Tetstr1/453189/TSEL_040206.t1
MWMVALKMGVFVSFCGPPGTKHALQGFFKSLAVEVPEDTGDAGKGLAQLLGPAVHHNLPEVWVAKHPVLALAYVFRFLPALGWMVLRKVGPKRARAVRDGKSGYDVQGLVGGDAGQGTSKAKEPSNVPSSVLPALKTKSGKLQQHVPSK